MSIEMPSTESVTALQTALLDWFRQNAADLPWRHSRDPYRIWISEIMLQQTQVATVIPYFVDFIARFPSIEKLAAASLEEVLKAWEGLGYYSRARNLYRAAQIVVTQRDGQFPRTSAELQRLPGIGRYTAGAIASIAFGEDVPALDGNVIRVLTRLFNIAEDVSDAGLRRRLWQIAERLVPAGQAGMWNEALMELGRLACRPSPVCFRCPLTFACEAHRLGVEKERPVRTRRQPIPHYDVTAAVIRRADGAVLIARRPTDKMLGGLWEFPGGKCEPGETLTDCLRREIVEELSLEVDVGLPIAVIRHAYTHFRITLHAFECRYRSGEPQALGCSAWAWVALDDLDRYAFAATDRRIIAVLRSAGQVTPDAAQGG